MPTIKRTTEGKIITRDGKPSCVCCNPCAGLWGPGYDTHPDPVVLTGVNCSRIAKCLWVAGLEFVAFNFYGTGVWNAYSPTTNSYKAGTYSDGPLGDYRANTDGTGAVIYTVA